MALSKLEARNSFAWMNWYGGAWPCSKILAKSSLIQTRVTLERKSAREHWFRAITHGSVRRVSKPGSLSPRHKFRVRTLSPQASQWRPRRKRVIKKLADIATAYATGERGMGKYTGRRLPRHTTRLHNSPSVCTSHVAGRTDTTSKIGCVPNRNSCGTTRNGEVPTNTNDALKWRRSSERLIYDVHKSNFGAGMSHVRHAGSTGG